MTSNLSKLFGCPRCLHAWDVQHEEGQNFEFCLPECPYCIEYDSVLLVEDLDVRRVITIISYADFVAMAMGFGAPQERIDPETLKYLLESRKILEVGVSGKKGRVRINHFKLDDGSVVHFSGDIAYKVTRE